jgi:hypothetical protein
LSVEEPFGDFVLRGILDDCDNTLEFFGGEFSSSRTLEYIFEGLWVPLVEVDVCLLDDDVGVSSAYTLDSGQGEHDLLLSINVGVEKTENVLEGILIGNHKSHGCVVVEGLR